jgi:hypothetical protein
MPFIEDFIADRKKPIVKPVGLVLEVGYVIKPVLNRDDIHEVIHSKAGTVFVGSRGECTGFVKQARAKQAIKVAERDLMTAARGTNPTIQRF